MSSTSLARGPFIINSQWAAQRKLNKKVDKQLAQQSDASTNSAGDYLQSTSLPTCQPLQVRSRQQPGQLAVLLLQLPPLGRKALQVFFVPPEQGGQGRALLPGAAPAAGAGWAE